MSHGGTSVLVWLNAGANAVGTLLAPVGYLPGWLSATLVAVVTGIAMLLIFKSTSNQRAIKRTRQAIRAHLLAIKLFKDNLAVVLRSQLSVFGGAMCLLALALVPMAVMLVPMTLLLGQLSVWYQWRPLRVGEETVVTVTLKREPREPWPRISLEPSEAVDVLAGPVRLESKREVCWSLCVRQSGQHCLRFQIDGQTVEKELAAGEGYMRTSAKRPPADWSEVLLHPCEAPFPTGATVQAIAVEYPSRDSWTSGTDYWLGYWFAVSLLTGFAFRRVLKVNL